MARQAEAEREKRAEIIDAEGESLAAAVLGDASDILMAHPLAPSPSIGKIVSSALATASGLSRTLSGRQFLILPPQSFTTVRSTDASSRASSV